jgi:hypothetical protein
VGKTKDALASYEARLKEAREADKRLSSRKPTLAIVVNGSGSARRPAGEGARSSVPRKRWRHPAINGLSMYRSVFRFAVIRMMFDGDAANGLLPVMDARGTQVRRVDCLVNC